MVAAVQGICYTIGIELMLAADIVIAAVADFEPTQTKLSKSNDVKEGVQSFVERRKAIFTGT